MNPSLYPPVWKIWLNPILRRYATARLRPMRLAAWSVVVQPLGAFLWLVVYFTTKRTMDVPHRALAAWTPILILQGLIWLLKGTFSVAFGIAREGAEGLTETQRLTPLSAWHKVAGYLFGLPILETVLVLSLLPWSAVSILIGKVPLAVVFRVYLLLFTSAILHHTIGLVAGTVIRQKIVAGTVSQLLVITIHFIVPIFSRFGSVPSGTWASNAPSARNCSRFKASRGNLSACDFSTSIFRSPVMHGSSCRSSPAFCCRSSGGAGAEATRIFSASLSLWHSPRGSS